MEVKKSPKADLTKTVTLFRELGLAVTLGIILLAFEWKSSEKQDNTWTEQTAVEIEEEIIPITQQEQQLPPEMPKIPVLSDAIDIVDDNIQIDDAVFSFEDEAGLGVEIKDYVTEVVEEEVEEEAIPFALVEQKPSFQGGDANNFSKWVNKNLVYPEIA
ncbi:MAG: energy transducer TonB, partial [Bacteroidales bacterium]|nr:energy transducer TonB [Bacteroidales bacterium]